MNHPNQNNSKACFMVFYKEHAIEAKKEIKKELKENIQATKTGRFINNK